MMTTQPLRRLVGTIGLLVAVVTAVSIPLGYAVFRYAYETSHLSEHARVGAAHFAKYIYTHPVMWQYQRERLVEILENNEPTDRNTRQSLLGAQNEKIVEAGPTVSSPILARSAPIIVEGVTKGRLDVESSFREFYPGISLVSLFSFLLGFAVYFAVRVFPLRALDRTLTALTETQRDLAAQNERFDVALTNMLQGLCMFDSDGKLVIFNASFAQIFGIPPDKIVPGMTVPNLMELAAKFGKAGDVEPEVTLAHLRELVGERKAGSMDVRLADGRTVIVSIRPMPDGDFVATFEDITDRLRAEERIRYLARFDALTDLPNRVTFYERLEQVLSHLRRNESVSILSLDLDHFKNVNDTLGHPIGDLLLRAAADRMRGCVRGEDIVARLGGDEFAVVQIPSPESPNVTALAARLIEEAGAPYELEGHQVVVGVSVGIAIAPADGRVPDMAMKNADLALYRAKADGGGTYRFFELEMDARMQARRALELDLRRAVVNGEFEVYYQPIIDVKTGRVKSCEALLRWHHPERGMVPPLEFVPVAEETGLIVPIGEWVLRQACAEAMRWPKDVTISVNLSPAQFKSRTFVRTVETILETSGLVPERLELEITELVLLQEAAGAFAVLHQLRDLGIKIAMDDFGTGYSSLGYLRSFPFDKIKIDQSFIRDLSTKQDSVAIVRAVVGLSSSLGIITTAEGVETQEQLARLATEGCNEAQGFLFSPPRPAAEIGQLLNELVAHPAGVA